MQIKGLKFKLSIDTSLVMDGIAQSLCSAMLAAVAV